MTYPPVIQFEERALEADAQARLARERQAVRAPKPTISCWQRLMRRLPLNEGGPVARASFSSRENARTL
jgi:hypothetical protein